MEDLNRRYFFRHGMYSMIELPVLSRDISGSAGTQYRTVSADFQPQNSQTLIPDVGERPIVYGQAE